jgi:hypothetical protein
MADKKMTLDEMVAEMNKTHALVLHDGRCMVFIQSEDSSQLKFVRPRELSRLCMNESYLVTYNGSISKKNKIKAWMIHPDCRRYPRGVYWQRVCEGKEVQHIHEAFNIWSRSDDIDDRRKLDFASRHGIELSMERN